MDVFAICRDLTFALMDEKAAPRIRELISFAGNRMGALARIINRRAMPRKRRLLHAVEGNYRKGLNRSRISND